MERYPHRFHNQNRFSQEHNEVPEELNNKIYWILGTILLILLAFLMYFLVYVPNQDKVSSNSNDDINQNSKEEPQTNNTNQNLISCEDWDCFIDASRNCNKSNFTNILSFEIFGINITTTSYYELKGLENSQCIFYLRTEEQHINFTEESIQQMIDAGTTPTEIEKSEREVNEQSNLLEGRDGQCKIKGKDLSNLLLKWKNGTFSGSFSCNLTSEGNKCIYEGDWEFFNNCEGNYFSQEL